MNFIGLDFLMLMFFFLLIQSVLNKTRPKKIQQFAKTERNEHHDGSIQRKNVISNLKKVLNFGCSNFNVRMDRQLGAGSFGVVFACDFGFKRKLQCVIKKSKPGAREELILEGRILLKIFEEPVDWRQKFFLSLTVTLSKRTDWFVNDSLDYQ